MSLPKSWTAAEQDRVTVVRLTADFSSIYESQLAELAGILELAESVAPPWLVFDLSSTQYFGSAFIGFLISMANRIHGRAGGRIAISGLSTYSRMALETTKADMLMELFGSIDEAVAALSTVRDDGAE